MKLLAGILLLSSVVLIQQTNAADLFVRQGTPPAAKTQTPPPVQAQPAPVNTPPPAAPVRSVNEFAGQYYKTCLSQQDAVLNGPNLELQCACASQKMLEQMTIDDINSMATQTADGEFQRNRLLLQVYAPCMQYPVRSILIERCAKDPNIQKTVATYVQACSCMGDTMASYVAQNGASIIAKTLRENPGHATSPLSNLMRDADFQTRAHSALATCISNPVPAPSLETPPPSAFTNGPTPLPPGQEVPQAPPSPPAEGYTVP